MAVVSVQRPIFQCSKNSSPKRQFLAILALSCFLLFLFSKRRRYRIIAVVGLILVLFTYFVRYNSFLDVLNDTISRNCFFTPFYAGVTEKPSCREFISELGEIEDNHGLIKYEVEQILKGMDSIPLMSTVYKNMVYKGETQSNTSQLSKKIVQLIYGDDEKIFDHIGSSKWRTFNLIAFNRDIPANVKKCPLTTSIVKRIPGVQTVMFSVLEPHSRIPLHTDISKGVIRYHFGVKIPLDREKCYINVNGEKYSWTEGKGVVFDDVYPHYAVNDTDEVRVILFIDILRKMNGVPALLQLVANWANYYHPGVSKLIKESEV